MLSKFRDGILAIKDANKEEKNEENKLTIKDIEKLRGKLSIKDFEDLMQQLAVKEAGS